MRSPSKPASASWTLAQAPGLLATEMATQVGPAGKVVGLDLSDSMLALSRERCGDLPTSECPSFLKADAARLPFADSMFDAAVSTQVYEYVPDVPAALAELYRVLRPGGRVLILDTDWDSIVWAAGDQARMQQLLEAWVDRFADPHLPRHLSWQLQSSGFRVHRREVLVLFSPEYDPDTYSIANGQIMADFAVAQGRLPREETEAWMRDLQRLGSEGRYFFSLNRYLFLATKRSLSFV
jgi:arsenite methyltransferase